MRKFAKGRSLGTGILHIRDQSTILAANYNSTQVCITLRVDFQQE